MQQKTSALENRNHLLAQKIIKNLENRKFEAYYCNTSSEAVTKALSLIPLHSTVSWGGSVTIEEIGLIKELYKRDYTLINRDNAKTPEERFSLMQKSLLCDTYLTSFNAISEKAFLSMLIVLQQNCGYCIRPKKCNSNNRNE